MNDLMTRRNYILGSIFERNAFTIYTGMQTNQRPPVLEEILFEVIWEDGGAEQFGITEAIREQDIINDIYAYMTINYMVYLSKEDPYIPISKAKLINPPSRAIW